MATQSSEVKVPRTGSPDFTYEDMETGPQYMVQHILRKAWRSFQFHTALQSIKFNKRAAKYQPRSKLRQMSPAVTYGPTQRPQRWYHGWGFRV